MATETQLLFLRAAYTAASQSGHIFPGAAAAETALESTWGTSQLAVKANNLFGLKKSSTWIGQTITLPTREYIDNAWMTVSATWPVFTSWAEGMTERMNTLHRLSCYADALKATTPEQFIERVSVHWSTGPNRANQVLSIFHAHRDILDPQQEAASCSITR